MRAGAPAGGRLGPGSQSRQKPRPERPQGPWSRSPRRCRAAPRGCPRRVSRPAARPATRSAGQAEVRLEPLPTATWRTRGRPQPQVAPRFRRSAQAWPVLARPTWEALAAREPADWWFWRATMGPTRKARRAAEGRPTRSAPTRPEPPAPPEPRGARDRAPVGRLWPAATDRSGAAGRARHRRWALEAQASPHGAGARCRARPALTAVERVAPCPPAGTA